MDSKGQNTNSQDIAGFKVFFQTMPKDIEALTKKEGLTKKEIKAEKLLPVPPQIKSLITEKESLKIKIRTLYQEGKSLYKRRFYQEAIEKFEEISRAKPSWLVNWYLNRAKKKLIKEEKLYPEAQKEIEKRIKIEAEAKKEAEEKLKKEEKERKLAEEKAKREEEKRLEAEQRLKLLREQKIIAEEKAKAEEKEKKIKELKPSFLFFRSLISKIESFSSPQVVKIIGIILLILLIIIGLIYWLGAKEIKKPQPEPPVTEIVLPNSLFIVDETEIITLKTGQEKKLFQDLQNFSEKKQVVASFRSILVKITNQEQKYIDLEEFLEALEITFPPEIMSSLENNYTLFFYSQKDLPISPFLAGLGRNKLGLIITISKKNEILQQVSLWEKTMEKDLEPLFLNKKMIWGPSQNQFQERYHHGSLIRYLDLPDRFVSLNYTFLNNKFIIATSQESINSLIEKITP